MPRALRKSLSRCSSRSSSGSSRSKLFSPRDSILSSIRDAVRSSSVASRRSNIERESPLLRRPTAASRMSPRVHQETKISGDFEPEAATPTAAKFPKEDVAAEKLRGLVQHGFRYIMLPLHLLHLCSWGSPETNENQSSSLKFQKIEKKSSSSPSDKNLARRSSASSPTSSTSGFSSCSSSLSKISREAPVVHPSMTSSASSDEPRNAESSAASSFTFRRLPVVDSSPEARPVPRRIFQAGASDESSDEMVTADECFDDSSNDRWSTAESSPSMNMSVDFEVWENGIGEIFNPTDEDCSVEEPMEVSVEESSANFGKSIGIRSPCRNFRLGSQRSKVERPLDRISSLSGSEQSGFGSREDISVSSADREIAGIFQRASTSPSSSSDDEDRFRFDGRRNNPLARRTSDLDFSRSRPREELCDAVIRKKRTALAYDDSTRDFRTRRIDRETPERPSSFPDRPSNSSRIKECSEWKNTKRMNREQTRIADQTDSAYSDEDVEMNSINESFNHRLQSFAMQSLQESVVEWMDQDLDYVADTEDSNDGSPLAGSPKLSSAPPKPKSRFVELDGLPVGRSSAPPAVEKTLRGDDSSLATRIALPQVGKKMDQLKKTPASPEVERPSDQWRKNFGLGESDASGHSETHLHVTKCHCGNPKCFFIPFTLPIDGSSTASWFIKDFPRAPSPLGQGSSFYDQFLEFIIPPPKRTGDKKLPYVLLPANFVLH